MTGKFIFIHLALICDLLLAYSMANERYPSKYDDIDIDEILANPRLRNQYIGCLVNTSPCVTEAARFVKDKFKEMYLTKCMKCTEKQVMFFDKVTEWFMINDPDTWKHIVEIILKELRNKNT
ncbi:Csp9 [Eciton burchellii]|nr:Csp9 [Eciton burchellii]